MIKALKKIQAKHIGIKNSRDQRLVEVNDLKEKFIDVYNSIYKLLKLEDYKSVKKDIRVSDEVIIYFYQKVRVLLSEENIQPKKIKLEKLSGPFLVLNELLNKLYRKTKATERNRFRRLVPVDRISSLSKMIYALSNENLYSNFFKTN